MRCPRCRAVVEPTDRVCPSCASFLVVEQRPSRPGDEIGWPVRRFGSVAGRAGSLLFAAHYVVVLVALVFLGPAILSFFEGSPGPADLSAAASIVVVASALDLVGSGLLIVAMVALGAGAVLMYRRDPDTDQEARVPAYAGTLAKGAGLFAFVWLLLTLAWRHTLPTQNAWTAAFAADTGTVLLPVVGTAQDLLAAYAANGFVSPPSAFQAIMFLWVLASVALAVSAGLLRSFARALPRSVVAPQPIESTAWFDFAVFNALVTIGIAAFPLGLLPFPGLEVLYRGLLATKLVVVSLFGIPTYVSLQVRLAALGNLALRIPSVRAVPSGAANFEAALADERALRARTFRATGSGGTEGSDGAPPSTGSNDRPGHT